MKVRIKNSILWGTLALMSGGFFFSCGENAPANKGEYLAVKQENEGLWGLIGPDGKMLFENEFKQNISDAVEGLFIVPENNYKILYKADKTPVPLAGYSDLLDVG